MKSDLVAALWGAGFGAIAGGIVSFVKERALDRSRKYEAISDQFSDLTFDFVATVQTYWSIEGQDNALQASIISGINKIKAKLVKLGFDLITDTEVRLLLKEVYQFSSGGGFASRSRGVDASRGLNVEKRMERLNKIVSDKASRHWLREIRRQE